MYKTWARSVPGACGGTVTGVATEGERVGAMAC